MTSPLAPGPTPSGPELASTIAGTTVHEIVIKKSRFITRLTHAETMAEADAVVAGVKKEFWDARHNCVAMIIGSDAGQQRSNDDGEPSGTAGVPMLEVLRHRHVTDVVAVVTRYFGGILLGAGGLVRAYSASVSETLDQARLVRRVHMDILTLDVPHAEAGRVEYFLRDWLAAHDARLESIDYAAAVQFTLLVPPHRRAELDAALAAHSAGTLTPIVIGARVADVPS